MILDRSAELRLIFSLHKQVKVSDETLCALIRSVGLELQPSDRVAITEAYKAQGPFLCEDFVNVAESLGFSKNAGNITFAALNASSYKNEVSVKRLHHVLSVTGKSLELSETEVEAFLVFQLGFENVFKPRIKIHQAMELIQ
jgi:hypothetical protein